MQLLMPQWIICRKISLCIKEGMRRLQEWLIWRCQRSKVHNWYSTCVLSLAYYHLLCLVYLAFWCHKFCSKLFCYVWCVLQVLVYAGMFGCMPVSTAGWGLEWMLLCSNRDTMIQTAQSHALLSNVLLVTRIIVTTTIIAITINRLPRWRES